MNALLQPEFRYLPSKLAFVSPRAPGDQQFGREAPLSKPGDRSRDAMMSLQLDQVSGRKHDFRVRRDAILTAALFPIARVEDRGVDAVGNGFRAAAIRSQRERELAKPFRYRKDAAGFPHGPRHQLAAPAIFRVHHLAAAEGDGEGNAEGLRKQR